MMAKEPPNKPAKLPRLPKSQKIQKRPLLHPPIPMPASSQQKIIYVSASTPFIATTKRVRALLSPTKPSINIPNEILLKGTGKAIEKVLSHALYWQGQLDTIVKIRTRSVGAVDDVVGEGEDDEEMGSRVRRVSCLEVGISLRSL